MKKTLSKKRTAAIIFLLGYCVFLVLSGLPPAVTQNSFLKSIKDLFQPVVHNTSILPGMELFRKPNEGTDLKMLRECVNIQTIKNNAVIAEFETESLCCPPLIRLFSSPHQLGILRVVQAAQSPTVNETRKKSLREAVGRAFCTSGAEVRVHYKRVINSYKTGSEISALNTVIKYDCAQNTVREETLNENFK